MATRSTYRSRLRTELKIDPSGRIWSDSTLNNNIQQAVYQVQQDGNYDWPFNDATNTTATVVSTATYNLPTAFVRIEAGTVKWNAQQLIPADFRWLTANNQSLAVDGNPSYYYLRGSTIGLFQRPNAIQNLTYLYRGKLADFSDDVTDNGMPNEFTEAISQYAAYLTWSDVEGRGDKAIESLQNYKQVLEGLNDQFLGARRDESNFGFGFEVVQNNWYNNELSSYN